MEDTEAKETTTLFDIETTRQRFSGRIRGDLSALYRVYCRISEVADASNDADLKKASDDLLRVWDDIATTATVKVLANGYVDWIKEVPSLQDGLASIARLVSDTTLRSHLSDDEWASVMAVAQHRSDTGGLYIDIHRALWAVNDMMEFDKLERGELLTVLLAVLREAWLEHSEGTDDTPR